MPPSGARGELVGLVRRIQALTIELEELHHIPGAEREVEIRERMREQLQWRLANLARRTATDDPDNAA